ncbi:MAG: outer membrane protein [Xanthobacteraceae bacterium]
MTTTFVPLDAASTSGGSGWFGTVGGGCDYQTGRFVIGVSADYDFMSLTGTLADPTFILPLVGPEKESGAGAVGVRLGYAAAPTMLTYVNGGWSQARFDQVNISIATPQPTPFGVTLPAQTYNGWFVGGGTEIGLGWLPGLFLRSEYRYAGYQPRDVLFVINATGTGNGSYEHVTTNVQTISTSLVWRFN